MELPTLNKKNTRTLIANANAEKKSQTTKINDTL
jgi:hypothetical protein